MIEYDYWNICSYKIIEKYLKLMKESRIVFSDIDIGCKCCYMYKTLELERRCTEATKIFNSLYREIDKFPKRYRGIVWAALRKFKL
jgi:hypothetical protein